jgi:hypothetical protein
MESGLVVASCFGFFEEVTEEGWSLRGPHFVVLLPGPYYPALSTIMCSGRIVLNHISPRVASTR